MADSSEILKYKERLYQVFQIPDNAKNELPILISYLLYRMLKECTLEQINKFSNDDIESLLGKDIYSLYKKIVVEPYNDIQCYQFLCKYFDKEIVKDYITKAISKSHRRILGAEQKEMVVGLIDGIMNFKDNDKVLISIQRKFEYFQKIIQMNNIDLTILFRYDTVESRDEDELEYMYLTIYANLVNEKVKVVRYFVRIESQTYNKIICETTIAEKNNVNANYNIIRSCMGEKGKALQIILSNTLFNSKDDAFYLSRVKDIDEKKLKAVISFYNDETKRVSNANNLKLILEDTHEKHSKAMFVNINMKEQEKNDESEVEENAIVDKVLTCIDNEVEGESILVPYEVIREKDYSYNMFDYSASTTGLNNPVFLEEVAKVFRGSTAVKAYTEHNETEVTHILTGRILSVTDLDNLQGDYTQIKECKINGEFSNFILEKGDIIFKKNGLSQKVVIFDGDKEMNIIPDGNLIIIRPNKEKILPEYLYNYLTSQKGVSLIENIAQSGTVLRSINIKRMVKLPVPLASLKEQEEYIEQYGRKEVERKNLELELEQLSQAIFFKN